jgi:hypothetical protein
MELGAAAAKRLQNSAQNTADSYARAIRNAAEEAAAAAKAAKKARQEEGRLKRRPRSGCPMGPVNAALEQAIDVERALVGERQYLHHDHPAIRDAGSIQ